MSGYSLIPIQSRVIASGENISTVIFSNIPPTFDDLIIYASTRDEYASGRGTRLRLRFNNDTTSSYSVTALGGNGASGFGFRENPNTEIPVGMNSSLGGSASAFSSSEIIILKYSQTIGFKNILANYVRGDNSTSSSADFMGQASGLWSKTDIINRIDIRTEQGSNYSVGTIFNLYGRKN